MSHICKNTSASSKRGKAFACGVKWYVFFSRCAPGYYGIPLSSQNSCRKCNCNGNSDPNLIFDDCDKITGYCRHCVQYTTGNHCERCAPGYYGDAINIKNCTGIYV